MIILSYAAIIVSIGSYSDHHEVFELAHAPQKTKTRRRTLLMVMLNAQTV
jgi:hypothetical protein